ncbi:MAG: ABC transporter permease [Algoriphagus sp.]|uniref:FtsX-like permease family protein n=1 Tax=Algoriphagus sp. TaxID=1872435 RepID=UPI002624ECD6|nr:FtsX-like permease family protein [Algoriphagus sp.]MDG1276687.1 ABC transporter permease [Algoriphagus sp.]
MDTKRKYFPPKWADRFLEFYCVPFKLEQIQGDAYELFYLNLEDRGLAYARFRYWIHVLSFFRWSNIKRTKTNYYTSNSTAMFKNYLKIGWRNLLKQKATTFISVFGLASAVGCCLVAYLFIANIWFKGMLQPNKNEIYQLTYTIDEEEGKVTYGTVAEPIAELLSNEFTQIKSQSRVKQGLPILIYQTESFYQRVNYVDPGFMDMFVYRMEYGYPQALTEPDQVILTFELSEKLFGDTHPVGQEISLVTDGEEKRYKVGGVMKKLNDMEIFNFDLLVNLESIESEKPQVSLKQSWDAELWTFVQLEKGVNPAELQAGLASIKKRQNEINSGNPYLSLDLIAYTDLVYQIGKIEKGVRNFLGLGPQILLGAIGLFILILAVFNYINISILMASRRLKEIGVRKVIGSRRGQLIAQFLSENLIVCFFALFIGCLLAIFVLLPGFNQVASKSLKLDLLHDPYLWMFLIGLMGFITLVSGLYPAVFVSGFKPVTILNGNQKLGSKSFMTSVLLTFQFTLAIISIVAGVAFLQTNYLNENRDWGYDNSDKIIVNVPDTKAYFTLKDQISAIASVKEVSGSENFIGNGAEEKEVTYQEQKYEVDYLEAEANYAEVLELRLISGRFLNSNLVSDQTQSLLVNERFMTELGLSFPVEESIVLDSVNYQIVGVVEDFHMTFFQRPIVPMVIRSGSDSIYNYLTLQMSPGTALSAMDLVKKTWREAIPAGLFEGKLQADVFEREFSDVRGIQHIIIFAAVLAVILAAMGLFGLVSLNMNSRIKDFCVRKVFGAGTNELTRKLFKRYLISWGIASILGGCLAFVMVNQFLDSFFAFHSGVGFIPLTTGLLGLLLVIGLTVSSQIFKVMKANPADILKSE